MKQTLPTMTEVQKGAIAADRLALTRPPGGQNAQHWVPVQGAVQHGTTSMIFSRQALHACCLGHSLGALATHQRAGVHAVKLH